MLKVTLDENNYVTGWCMVGDNGGIDVELPEDLDGFMDCFTGYKVVDGLLVLGWLKVTDTLTPPERPDWIDNTDSSRIPLTPGGLF